MFSYKRFKVVNVDFYIYGQENRHSKYPPNPGVFPGFPTPSSMTRQVGK